MDKKDNKDNKNNIFDDKDNICFYCLKNGNNSLCGGLCDLKG